MWKYFLKDCKASIVDWWFFNAISGRKGIKWNKHFSNINKNFSFFLVQVIQEISLIIFPRFVLRDGFE